MLVAVHWINEFTGLYVHNFPVSYISELIIHASSFIELSALF